MLLTQGCASVENSNDQAGIDVYWEPSTPSEEGVNPLVIYSLHQDIEQGIYGYIDHFFINRNGKLIVDEHYRSVMEKYDSTNHQYNYDHIDWHPYYNHTDLHTLQISTQL